ncbi:MAG: LysR family transcriptional regulator [Pseudomonadota bacterium]
MVLRDHLEKLYYFFEVAKAGSFKEASNKIAITQPSITKSVQVLENGLELKLFRRKPRGVELTLEGELLLNYCHQLFSQLNDLEIKMKSPEDPMAGSLKVGTFDSIAIYFWPQFLKGFLSKYPRLNLELTTGRSHEIQQMVEKGKLDIGLIVEPRTTQHSNAIPLAQDSFHLYESTEATKIYETRNKAPLVYMADALAGEEGLILERVFDRLEGDLQRILYQTSSLESAKEFTASGIGLGLLPKLVAAEGIERGKISPISIEGFPEDGIGQHNIGLVYSKYRENSETLRTLVEEIKQHPWPEH